jgi:hypothetical protein
MDHQSVPTSVLHPLVVPVPKSLQPRGPNRRVQPRLRHLVRRVSSPRPVGQHNCASPYQCFGDHCFMEFPGLHPPKVVKATQYPLEGQQHHGPGLHQEGRGYMQSTSPSGSGKGSGDGAPDVRPLASGLHPHGENILADAASRFQEIPDWHLHPFVFRAITTRWGLPKINLFASNASKQT